MLDKYVIDASMGYRGSFCFCPVDTDGDGEIVSVITGLNLLTDIPPGKLVAIVHEDGQAAVEAFCEEFSAELAELKAAIEERDGKEFAA